MERDPEHRILQTWIRAIDTRLAVGSAGPEFWLKVRDEAPPEAMAYLRLRFDDGEGGE